jgi:tRNA(Ile)-lysidine synthase
VRPFLQVTRAQLALCAAHYAIPWLADPSNDDLKLTRNHVRHIALPALEAAIPGAAAGLARTAELAASQEGALLAWMDSALNGRIVVDHAARCVTVPVDAVPLLAPARAALLRWVCQHLAIAAPSVRAVDQWLVLGTRGEARMRGLTVVGDGHAWQFFANNVARPEPAD